MSANYYYAKDKTADYKFATISGATATATVWTPVSGKSIVITGFIVSSTLGDLVTFKKGTTNGAPDTLFAFNVSASSYISPDIGPIELKDVDNILYVNASNPGTNGVRVLVTGFET